MNDSLAVLDVVGVCISGEGDLSTGKQRCEDVAKLHDSKISQALTATAPSIRSSNKRDLEALHLLRLDELTALLMLWGLQFW